MSARGHPRTSLTLPSLKLTALQSYTSAMSSTPTGTASSPNDSIYWRPGHTLSSAAGPARRASVSARVASIIATV